MSTRNKIGFGIIICLSSVLGVTALIDIFIEGGIVVGTTCTAIISLITLGLVLMDSED
ncbi:endoplasmic reticulum-based factor for assembly of V-ATPase [Lactiplantibacillus plantarum]|nr:endoplasmic reticulum-based factor for assembly of V-ATPase [Lactiplantibacillus plantarum]MCG0744222.1 endoplasmic reticulum-based factor for assembly of V-ATPase [Lactiplantibacillus plantarum]MCG0883993.1 endoplasmic reticulum-based factor for assembly of V-ATPase [Lactiplantibacillus plantarum]